MSRIAWSEYSGVDVEHVVAMFLALDFPTTAQAITPSRGDGGIDVMVRLDEGWAVYQVKKFASALGSSQKRQVRESMDALCRDPRVQDLDVREWHVVMPWDSTPEERLWLKREAASRKLPEPLWHGLAWCNAQASKHPTVVDFYLQGGRDTIRSQALEMVALFQPGGVADAPGPADVLGRVEKLARAINATSPHYEYAFSTMPVPAGIDPSEFLDQIAQQPAVHPGHVMSRAMAQRGVVALIHVLARTAMSTALEPITSTATVTVRPQDRQQVEDFLVYGTGLELPLGSAEGVLKGPAGIGGPFTNAALRLTPHRPQTDSRFRLMVLDPTGHQLACVPMRLSDSTSGAGAKVPSGYQAVLVDDLGLLTATARWTENSSNQTLLLEQHLPTPCSAIDALPVVALLAHFHHPNRVLVAGRRGPYDASAAHDIPAGDPDVMSRTTRLHRIVHALCVLQERTTRELHVPTEVGPDDDWLEVVESAALASGEVLTIVLPDEHVIAGAAGAFAIVGDHVEFRCEAIVEIPETTIELGEKVYSFPGSLRQTVEDPTLGSIELWNVEGGALTVRLGTL